MVNNHHHQLSISSCYSTQWCSSNCRCLSIIIFLQFFKITLASIFLVIFKSIHAVAIKSGRTRMKIKPNIGFMKRTKMIAKIIPKRPCRNVEPLHPDAPFVRNVSLISVKLRAPVLRFGYGVNYYNDFLSLIFAQKSQFKTKLIHWNSENLLLLT